MPDMLEEFARETIEKLLNELPVEKLLQGLTVEQRLQGLTAEQRFQGLYEADLRKVEDMLRETESDVPIVIHPAQT